MDHSKECEKTDCALPPPSLRPRYCLSALRRNCGWMKGRSFVRRRNSGKEASKLTKKKKTGRGAEDGVKFAPLNQGDEESCGLVALRSPSRSTQTHQSSLLCGEFKSNCLAGTKMKVYIP